MEPFANRSKKADVLVDRFMPSSVKLLTQMKLNLYTLQTEIKFDSKDPLGVEIDREQHWMQWSMTIRYETP